MFRLLADALDLAERYRRRSGRGRPRSRHERSLSEPFEWDEARRFDRGKVLDAELEAAPTGELSRHDGDGIGVRTLPGTHPERAPSSRAARLATSMRVHGRRRRLRAQHGSPGRSGRPRASAEGGDREVRNRPHGLIFYGTTAVPCGGRSACQAGIEADACGAGFPFGGGPAFMRAMRRCSSSSRTVTVNAAMLIAELDRSSSARAGANYDGVPITAARRRGMAGSKARRPDSGAP